MGKKPSDFYALIEGDDGRRYVGRDFDAAVNGCPTVYLWGSDGNGMRASGEMRDGERWIVIERDRTGSERREIIAEFSLEGSK